MADAIEYRSRNLRRKCSAFRAQSAMSTQRRTHSQTARRSPATMRDIAAPTRRGCRCTDVFSRGVSDPAVAAGMIADAVKSRGRSRHGHLTGAAMTVAMLKGPRERRPLIRTRKCQASR
jgi:hypothetical protein